MVGVPWSTSCRQRWLDRAVVAVGRARVSQARGECNKHVAIWQQQSASGGATDLVGGENHGIRNSRRSILCQSMRERRSPCHKATAGFTLTRQGASGGANLLFGNARWRAGKRCQDSDWQCPPTHLGGRLVLLTCRGLRLVTQHSLRMREPQHGLAFQMHTGRATA